MWAMSQNVTLFQILKLRLPLLLRTIRMSSQRLGRVSSVVAYTQTNNQTNQERLY